MTNDKLTIELVIPLAEGIEEIPEAKDNLHLLFTERSLKILRACVYSEDYGDEDDEGKGESVDFRKFLDEDEVMMDSDWTLIFSLIRYTTIRVRKDNDIIGEIPIFSQMIKEGSGVRVQKSRDARMWLSNEKG